MQNYNGFSEKIARGYTLRERAGLVIAQSDGLAGIPEIAHGFSTRVGGVSSAPFDSLNFSLTRDDNKANVARNYRVFCSAFGFDPASVVLINHEHGTNVLRVDRSFAGRGLVREPLPYCDGLITDDPTVTLFTLHADCSCVYIYDREHHAIGIAHAGWKGTFRRVGQIMAEKMADEFGTKPEDAVAAIGPCICRDCFEVDESIGEDFAREFDFDGIRKAGKPGKAYVDIEAALAIQLLDAGVRPENMSIMGLCTYERRDLFYSYRRDRESAGAMIGFMKLL